MGVRVDEDTKDLMKAVLYSEIGALIMKFNEASGWTVTDVTYQTTEVNEMGKRRPLHICTGFKIRTE